MHEELAGSRLDGDKSIMSRITEAWGPGQKLVVRTVGGGRLLMMIMASDEEPPPDALIEYYASNRPDAVRIVGDLIETGCEIWKDTGTMCLRLQ